MVKIFRMYKNNAEVKSFGTGGPDACLRIDDAFTFGDGGMRADRLAGQFTNHETPGQGWLRIGAFCNGMAWVDVEVQC
jgi:hypothetical protein